MKKQNSAFTIVEISLVLAITGLILIGIISGTGILIRRQRQNSTYQEFVHLLEEQYAYVENPYIAENDSANFNAICQDLVTKTARDSSGGYYSTVDELDIEYADGAQLRGRSSCTLHGVAIVLGLNDGMTFQSTPLIGADISKTQDQAYNGLAYFFNESSSQVSSSGGDISESYNALRNAQPDNLLIDSQDSNNCRTTGVVSYAKLPWEGRVETVRGDIAKAVIFILKSPTDGKVYTLFRWLANDAKIPDYLALANGDTSQCASDYIKLGDILQDDLYIGDLWLCLRNAETPLWNLARNTTLRRTAALRVARGHTLTLPNYTTQSGITKTYGNMAFIDEDTSENYCNKTPRPTNNSAGSVKFKPRYDI